MLIELRNISKTFNNQEVVSNLSLQIDYGEVLGLLGPNGSGKSTTMKMIAGYLKPSKGKIFVCGYDVSLFPKETKSSIGYLPENNPLYDNMYVYEYLRFMGNIYGLKTKEINKRILNTVEECGIGSIQNKKQGTLSKGFKQRVGLAQVLLHNPKVLVLDEPTSGLDPNQLSEIRNLIKEIAKNKAVILSSHVMQEVEAICDRVVIINKGLLVLDNKVDSLQERNYPQIILQIKEKVDPNIFSEIKAIKKIEYLNGKYILHIKSNKDIREDIFIFIKNKNLTLLEFKKIKGSLEDIFSKLTK